MRSKKGEFRVFTVPASETSPTTNLLDADNRISARTWKWPIAARAMSAIDAFRPNVVLLDIHMPGVDGYELAQRIWERAHLADILLISLAGWGQKEDRRRVKPAGFDRHLVKPADITSPQVLLAANDTMQPVSLRCPKFTRYAGAPPHLGFEAAS